MKTGHQRSGSRSSSGRRVTVPDVRSVTLSVQFPSGSLSAGVKSNVRRPSVVTVKSLYFVGWPDGSMAFGPRA